MDLDQFFPCSSHESLFGDDFVPTVPPSLLASTTVMDLAMHPSLSLFAVGLVTGEVEVHEYRPTETRRRSIMNQHFKHLSSRAPLSASPYNLRMHPEGGITSMEFTENGNYLVTASSDRTISVLDCVAEQVALHIGTKLVDQKKTKKTDKVQSAPDTKKLRNGKDKNSSSNNGVCKENKKSSKTNPHKFGISAINVCDENVVASGDDDGMIVLWDMRQRAPAHHYHEHGDFVSQMIYFSDIQELVSCSGDTCLGVFDMRAGKIRDYSEKRKDELSCFAFVNNTGNNTSNFIPSIVCGTPHGGLPVWKFGSWRRPYDLMERHPAECESILSFNNPDSPFNHNIILTGACDGLVRVIQMYPVRRNICQLSARDFAYSHGAQAGNAAQAGMAVRRQRGHEGITRMRLSHDSKMLAVSGHDNIIDFVDVRFLSDEAALNKLRSRAEQRHLAVIKEMEEERENEESGDSDENSQSKEQSDCESDNESSSSSSSDENNIRERGAKRSRSESATVVEEKESDTESDDVPEQKTERQKRRERAEAVKWLKEEKKKKVNFTFEKRRRRVHGFFGDLA